MDQSEDLPPPRRPLFLPVVIATVFLTIIGMSAGLALGARHKRASADDQPRNNSSSVVTDVPEPTYASPGPPLCPSHTQELAPQYGSQGVLTIALELRTDHSTVWICQDRAGALFYHANKGGDGGPWIEGQTALFIPGVRAVGGQYLVTAADGVIFRINSQRLEIVHKNGRIETQKAVD